MADRRKGKKKPVVQNLSKGVILTDSSKVEWELDLPIGSGGFGTIYNAKKVGSKGNATNYAAKVEPHGSGPLFVEKTFFIRNLKPEMIDEWKKKLKLSFLGLPQYIGSGTYKQGDVEHRFLIMERFGNNINSKLTGSTSPANLSLLSMYCNQIVDSLRYIHGKGYAHMDVKPENLLLKYGPKTDQVYLIDFGIIDKYTTEKELKPDKKKQHNGTLIYCSRDSHLGVGTMRGDLEILGYNIIEWCGHQLPWKNDKNASTVQQKKINLLSNLHAELDNVVPEAVIEYFTYVNSLKHDQTPDYEVVKSILDKLAKPETAKSTQKRKNISAVDESPPKKKNANDDSTAPPVKKAAGKKKEATQAAPEVSNGNGTLPVKKTTIKKKKDVSPPEVDDGEQDEPVKKSTIRKKKVTSPKVQPVKKVASSSKQENGVPIVSTPRRLRSNKKKD